MDKLNISVSSGQKAKASDFNAVSSKVDELVDAVNSFPQSSSGSSGYYGVCSSNSATQYKEISISDFTLSGGYPINGAMVAIRFVNGNSAVGMNVKINSSYSIPVYYGSAPVEPGDIDVDNVVSMVYDSTDGRWYIEGGVNADLPVLHITEYNLKYLMAGTYGSYAIAALWQKLIGDGSHKMFEGCQILMPWGSLKNSLTVNLVEEETQYTFAFIYNNLYYSFRLSKNAQGNVVFDVVENGIEITTVWEE